MLLWTGLIKHVTSPKSCPFRPHTHIQPTRVLYSYYSSSSSYIGPVACQCAETDKKRRLNEQSVHLQFWGDQEIWTAAVWALIKSNQWLKICTCRFCVVQAHIPPIHNFTCCLPVGYNRMSYLGSHPVGRVWSVQEHWIKQPYGYSKEFWVQCNSVV